MQAKSLEGNYPINMKCHVPFGPDLVWRIFLEQSWKITEWQVGYLICYSMQYYFSNKGVVNNYGGGGGVVVGYVWKYFENLQWPQTFWRFTWGAAKTFSIFYLKYACHYYGMTSNIFCAFEGGLQKIFLDFFLPLHNISTCPQP